MVVAVAFTPHAPRAALAPAPDSLPRVVANDNRVPAGTRRDGGLVLALVAREATWHPEGDAGPGAPMLAFAEEGGSPRIPGPLVRVRAGVVAEVTVRNALADTLRVFGLVDRVARPVTAADSTMLVVPPGARRTVRLRLDVPGTYLYWGTTSGRTILWRTGRDTPLSGALVVDLPGDDPARPRDRVLVLGVWSDTVHRSGTHRARVLATVNGRAWPHTERFVATVGDTVRWRVINASADLHPLHLHGFFFRVLARGDELRDRPLGPPGAGGIEAVTEAITSGTTATIAWRPERPGHWLAHCHVPEHFAARGPLGTLLPPGAGGQAMHGDHARGGMGGMVVAIDVAPRGGARPSATTSRGERRLRLLVRPTVGSTDSVPLYAYAVHEGGVPEPPADTGLVASPVLDLVRGQPVRIVVVNRLREPTAVHWHGIELDAYYDGVPGFSGTGRRVTPMIAPGDSFTVRFTPPRAGTFIYHTHADELRQQTAGLTGAIVVREPGTRRDTTTDHVLVLTSPTEFALNRKVLLVNARARPLPLVLRVGKTYRLRFIGMSVPRAAASIELRRTAPSVGADSLLAWVPVAKDGATLPAWARTPQPARQVVAIGETADYEVTPTEPGALELQARFGVAPTGRAVGPVILAARVPVQVLPAVRPSPPGAASRSRRR